jgi:hypothetical protein
VYFTHTLLLLYSYVTLSLLILQAECLGNETRYFTHTLLLLYSYVTPALLVLQAECLGNETRPDILTMAQATRYAHYRY